MERMVSSSLPLHSFIVIHEFRVVGYGVLPQLNSILSPSLHFILLSLQTNSFIVELIKERTTGLPAFAGARREEWASSMNETIKVDCGMS